MSRILHDGFEDAGTGEIAGVSYTDSLTTVLLEANVALSGTSVSDSYSLGTLRSGSERGATFGFVVTG